MVAGFESAKAAKRGPKQLVPLRYATDASELTLEVHTSGKSDLRFELTSKPAK